MPRQKFLIDKQLILIIKSTSCMLLLRLSKLCNLFSNKLLKKFCASCLNHWSETYYSTEKYTEVGFASKKVING